MPPLEYYVCAIPFSHCLDKVFLLNKSSPEKPKVFLDGVDGVLPNNETPRDAIGRVFLATTGIDVEPARWSYVGGSKREGKSIIFFGIQLGKEEIPKTTAYEKIWTVYWKNYTQRTWQDLGVAGDIFYLINKAHYLHHSPIEQSKID